MNRAARLSEARGFSQSSRAVDRAPAAEPDDLQRSAAFSHYTESVGVVPALGSASAGNASDKIPVSNSRSAAHPAASAPAINPKPPALAGADFSLTQGSAVVEARAAHNREVAGSTPAPATRSVGLGLAPAGAPAGSGSDEIPALLLSPPAMILLRAIAAYEQCSNEQTIVLALASHATKIGIGPLARAVLDEREDLTDLPAYERRPQNRFKGV